MMTVVGWIALPVGVLLFSVWSHLELYKRGYAKGRKDADNWWIGAEAGVDKTREKIWREEG
jgi:hypothetical protein